MKEMHFEIFEKRDYDLLERDIPDNPCNRCSIMERATCCGCKEYREYDRLMKLYKDSNLFGFAEEIHDMEKQIKEIKLSVNACMQIYNRLPKDVKENVDKVKRIKAFLDRI